MFMLAFNLLTRSLVDLPAHFAVWLASEEADFLRGRFVWSNWDVVELQEKKSYILEHDLLKLKLDGFQ